MNSIIPMVVTSFFIPTIVAAGLAFYEFGVKNAIKLLQPKYEAVKKKYWKSKPKDVKDIAVQPATPQPLPSIRYLIREGFIDIGFQPYNSEDGRQMVHVFMSHLNCPYNVYMQMQGQHCTIGYSGTNLAERFTVEELHSIVIGVNK